MFLDIFIVGYFQNQILVITKLKLGSIKLCNVLLLFLFLFLCPMDLWQNIRGIIFHLSVIVWSEMTCNSLSCVALVWFPKVVELLSWEHRNKMLFVKVKATERTNVTLSSPSTKRNINTRKEERGGEGNVEQWTGLFTFGVPEITTCIALRGSLRDPQIMPLTVFK